MNPPLTFSYKFHHLRVICLAWKMVELAVGRVLLLTKLMSLEMCVLSKATQIELKLSAGNEIIKLAFTILESHMKFVQIEWREVPNERYITLRQLLKTTLKIFIRWVWNQFLPITGGTWWPLHLSLEALSCTKFNTSDISYLQSLTVVRE